MTRIIKISTDGPQDLSEKEIPTDLLKLSDELCDNLVALISETLEKSDRSNSAEDMTIVISAVSNVYTWAFERAAKCMREPEGLMIAHDTVTEIVYKSIKENSHGN